MPTARAAWKLTSALGLVLASALPTYAAHAQERGATPPASAGDVVRSEVFVVLAAEAEGAIDPSLADIPALRQPPFNAFHSMSVLSRTTAELSSQRPIEVALPNGRQLRIELERQMPDGRYRVRVSINTPGQADYLPLLQIVASPGDPFFVAGQNWQGGTLVIGVRIGQRPAARKST
ncbi:MAG: hypothetical protein M3Y87_12760 [Myxococcota bacterium]|nr:hypothetical protein [Myxococcota bacterium]